jgi:hypothetical protein
VKTKGNEEEVILEHVTKFPGIPPIEEVTKGMGVIEAYRKGLFCYYCPGLVMCTSPISQRLRHEMKLEAYVLLFLEKSEVERIKAGRSFMDAYTQGAFCVHCPKFVGCINEPAVNALLKEPISL